MPKGPKSIDEEVSNLPFIFNLTLTLADTEYALALPVEADKVLIKARVSTDELKLSYTLGESGTNYITVPAGTSYWDDMIGGVSRQNNFLTLYIQSPTAGAVVEILVWA